MYTSLLLVAICASTSISASPLRRSEGNTPPAPAPIPNPTLSPELLKDLSQQPTTVDRFAQLLKTDPGAAPLKFDFNPGANPAFASTSGGVVVANRKNFAPLVDLGIGSAMGFMSPCSINTAHTHPRSAEFLTVVSGQIETGFVLENGLATPVTANLTTFQGTVFPMGSVHFQVNSQCHDAVFVAGFNSDDPGASTIAQNFFALPSDVLMSTLGFPDTIDAANLQAFKDLIPKPFASGVQECLDRCGLN